MYINPLGVATAAALALAAILVSPWFLVGVAVLIVLSAVAT